MTLAARAAPGLNALDELVAAARKVVFAASDSVEERLAIDELVVALARYDAAQAEFLRDTPAV
jgi:hypothetical protein